MRGLLVWGGISATVVIDTVLFAMFPVGSILFDLTSLLLMPLSFAAWVYVLGVWWESLPDKKSLPEEESSAPRLPALLWTLRHPYKRWQMAVLWKKSVQAYEAEKRAEWDRIKRKPKPSVNNSPTLIGDNPATWLDRGISSVSSYGAQVGEYVSTVRGDIPLDEKLFSNVTNKPEFRVGQRVTRYWRGREVKDSGVIVGKCSSSKWQS